jgi:nitrate reductase gamma subunit
VFGFPTVDMEVGSLLAFFAFHGLVWSALLVIAGVMLAFRRRMRDEGAAASQHFAEDFMPLILLFAVSLSGLLLMASYTWMRGYAYDFLAILHAATVIFTLLWLPFGKFFHVFQRPGFTSRMHVEDLILVERALGYRYESDANPGHYQWICPACRRALLAIAQGRLWGREVRSVEDGLPAKPPAYANPGQGSGPLGVEDRNNFHP